MTENAYGPFATERQASNSPAARAVYAAFDADPGPGKMKPHNLAILTAACEAAEGQETFRQLADDVTFGGIVRGMREEESG